MCLSKKYSLSKKSLQIWFLLYVSALLKLLTNFQSPKLHSHVSHVCFTELKILWTTFNIILLFQEKRLRWNSSSVDFDFGKAYHSSLMLLLQIFHPPLLFLLLYHLITYFHYSLLLIFCESLVSYSLILVLFMMLLLYFFCATCILYFYYFNLFIN